VVTDERTIGEYKWVIEVMYQTATYGICIDNKEACNNTRQAEIGGIP
jgi:hypothetical protein